MKKELLQLLSKHVKNELNELETHVSRNDLDGILENIKNDIDNRINEYVEVVNGQ